MEWGGDDRIEAFYLFIWTSINGLLLLLLVDGFLEAENGSLPKLWYNQNIGLFRSCI